MWSNIRTYAYMYMHVRLSLCNMFSMKPTKCILLYIWIHSLWKCTNICIFFVIRWITQLRVSVHTCTYFRRQSSNIFSFVFSFASLFQVRGAMLGMACWMRLSSSSDNFCKFLNFHFHNTLSLILIKNVKCGSTDGKCYK